MSIATSTLPINSSSLAAMLDSWEISVDKRKLKFQIVRFAWPFPVIQLFIIPC